MYVKTHSFHWNVEGDFFIQYHDFFGKMYQEIWESVDDIAEQIRQLDAYSPSSMERFIQLSQIKENNDILKPRDMVIDLLKDQEIIIDVLTKTLHLAEQEDKQGLLNFLAGRIEAHSKMRWQLRVTSKRIS